MSCEMRPLLKAVPPAENTLDGNYITRSLVHGLGFGALYLLASSGTLVGLYRFTASSSPSESIVFRNNCQGLPAYDGLSGMGRFFAVVNGLSPDRGANKTQRIGRAPNNHSRVFQKASEAI
jgi:hypothetical protein